MKVNKHFTLEEVVLELHEREKKNFLAKDIRLVNTSKKRVNELRAYLLSLKCNCEHCNELHNWTDSQLIGELNRLNAVFVKDEKKLINSDGEPNLQIIKIKQHLKD